MTKLTLERGLNTFREQIDAPVAAFFSSCVHCGICAQACLFYTETGDPRYTPINKLEPLKRIWEQEYTLWGKTKKLLGLTKPVTDELLELWEPLIYDSCTLCGRCSEVCPVGNDISAMIRKAREGMVASGHAPEGLVGASTRAVKVGSPMGIKLPALLAQIKHVESDMEVGPLARVLMLYANGHEPTKDLVNMTLNKLDMPVTGLFSTLGRTAARTLETKLLSDQIKNWYEQLITNIKLGDTKTFNDELWEPSRWPSQAQGVGFMEAPRGALGHWIVIKDGLIDNYQAVVPSTWNAGPRDQNQQSGAYEAALEDNHEMANVKQPLEILRTIHSFDPCIACAVHVTDKDGEELIQVKVE